MTSLVFVTQQVDPEHPVLAATVPKIRALAQRFDEVVVLAASATPGVLPVNCRVVTFGAAGRLQRGRSYASALNRELARKPAAVLVHMTPLLAVLAAPLATARHSDSALVHALEALADACPRRARLVRRPHRGAAFVSTRLEEGGGDRPRIDLDRFPCTRRDPASRLRVLALGRTSPAKGYETIVRAAALADVDLEVRGPSFTDEERTERARLEALGVRVEEPVPYADVPGLLFGKDVFVNNMREGALDKVVYEAAATCMPVLASNSGFDDVLPAELRFRREDADDLAAKLTHLRDADRNAIGIGLRAAVEERHSVGHWADEVLQVTRR